MTIRDDEFSGLAARSEARAWWGLAAVLFTAFVATTGSLVGAVTAAEQVADLGSNIEAAGLSAALALAVTAALLVPAGRLADRFGHKRTWMYGTALLAVSQLAIGAARTANSLWVLKALQGVAVAVVLPSVLTLTLTLFPPGRRRAVAIAAWTTALAIALALAPLWAGIFTSLRTGWRGAYLVGGAVTFVPIGVGWMVLRDRHELDRTRYEGFDMPGTLLLAAWCLTFVVFLEQGRYFGWFRSATTLSLFGVEVPVRGVTFAPVLLVLSVLLGWAFWHNERRRSRRKRVAVVEWSLVKHRTFRTGVIGLALIYFGSYGVLYVMPVYLSNGLGETPFVAGGCVAAVGLGVLIGAQAVTYVGRRLPLRSVVAGSVLLQPAGLAALALTSGPTTPLWLVTTLLAAYGIGWGAAGSAVVNLVYLRIPERLTGAATGTQLAARVLAGAVGTAVLGSVMTGFVVSGLRDAVPPDANVSPAQRAALVALIDETVVTPSTYTSRGQRERPDVGNVRVLLKGDDLELTERRFRSIYARGVRMALWIATLVTTFGVIVIRAIPADDTWSDLESEGFDRVANPVAVPVAGDAEHEERA